MIVKFDPDKVKAPVSVNAAAPQVIARVVLPVEVSEVQVTVWPFMSKVPADTVRAAQLKDPVNCHWPPAPLKVKALAELLAAIRPAVLTVQPFPLLLLVATNEKVADPVTVIVVLKARPMPSAGPLDEPIDNPFVPIAKVWV